MREQEAKTGKTVEAGIPTIPCLSMGGLGTASETNSIIYSWFV